MRLSSIGSEIELTQSSVFDLVRLPNSIEPNPWIEFECEDDSFELRKSNFVYFFGLLTCIFLSFP